MNAPAIPTTENHNSDAFAFKEVRGRSTVVIALAILLILPALLLSGVARIGAIAGILFIVGVLLDAYRFEVDPVSQKIKILTLWLGWRKRGAVTYGFSDVVRLEKRFVGGYGDRGYRWRFRDGATYELFSPLDERLYELFRENEDAGVRKREGTSDYVFGLDWRLVDRADEIVLEPNIAGGAIGTWILCGAIVATFSLLAVCGSVPTMSVVVSAVVCGMAAVLVAWYFVSETRRGPWLRFDRVRRRLILPGWGLEFDADSLVGWETKRAHWDIRDETIPVTELRLVVREAGGEERYVLLACRDHSAAYWWRAARSRFVWALAEELAALTGLPIRVANCQTGPMA